jgi:FdhE protein
MISFVSEPPGERPLRTRADSREVTELKALRDTQPELADAIDMHLELVALQRRIQGRVPLPSVDLTAESIADDTAHARPLLRFEDIPLDITDLRLMVRQTADVLRRFGALEPQDQQLSEAMGRDMRLVDIIGEWYRRASGHPAVASVATVAVAGSVQGQAPLDQVFALAMRPFLSRCAEVFQQRPELGAWTHPHCPMCGGEPDLAVITPAAERHLICGRCGLRWKFEPLTCPYCLNANRSRITSFATPDGKYRVYGCDACQRYLKAYDGRRAPRPVMPVVDMVATLPLDAAAIQRGYQ